MRESVILDHLTIGYPGKHGDHIVARDICAEIRRGELTCLLGSNGVGKSTLLRTLSAFQPKLSGRILIGDCEISSYKPKQLAREIGVVLTEKPDVLNMTVLDMVLMGRSPYTGFWGGCTDDDRQLAHEAISQVGISHLTSRRVNTLSDGERQKVMIAKALAQQTPIIFLDEPTAFLDFPSKIEMIRLLHRISREAGKTIFLSTHDLELALQLADTVWLMDRERGVCIGSPEDLAIDGTLPAFFAGRGILFDQTTGLFRVDQELTSAVRMMGLSGFRRAMAEKALRRNGIRPDTADIADRTVEVTDGGFSVTVGEHTVHVATVADMLACLLG